MQTNDAWRLAVPPKNDPARLLSRSAEGACSALLKGRGKRVIRNFGVPENTNVYRSGTANSLGCSGIWLGNGAVSEKDMVDDVDHPTLRDKPRYSTMPLPPAVPGDPAIGVRQFRALPGRSVRVTVWLERLYLYGNFGCMKKTLQIDEETLRQARAACGAMTDTETVRLGLESLIRRAAYERLRRLRGAERGATDVPRRRQNVITKDRPA